MRVARASNKTERELLEAWVSHPNSINRHVDKPPCYIAIRCRDQKPGPSSSTSVQATTSRSHAITPGTPVGDTIRDRENGLGVNKD
ncbi:unnamed protein product [Dibothriocephalus latus]|uniref:Uncharacterized protein n=1 Tax=Dibothriocephalus latus TaxID=60516 RepID=A0A3P7LLM0_DIBLA|nr:unnamed protein product [Dibothriocephalus latus]